MSRSLVRFKAVAGREDQPRDRCALQDQENYYITRANALENNVRLLQGCARQAHAVRHGADVPVASGQWHSLKLVVRGPQIQVFLNDTLILQPRTQPSSRPARSGCGPRRIVSPPLMTCRSCHTTRARQRSRTSASTPQRHRGVQHTAQHRNNDYAGGGYWRPVMTSRWRIPCATQRL